MNYLFNKIREYLLAFNIGLGPVIWFMDFSLGSIKLILFISLILLHFKVLLYKKTYRYWNFFLIIIFLLFISLFKDLNYSNDKLLVLFTFIQNYYFFILGYYYINNNLISIRFIKSILSVVVFFCILTISNFIIGIPDWIQPFQIQKFEEMQVHNYERFTSPLYSTGFGLARTGWATTLSQFIPLALILREFKNNIFGNLSLLIITSSIVFTGSRGGLLITLFIISIYIILRLPLIKQFLIFLAIISISLFLVYSENSFLYEFYRLDSDDISTGRAILYNFVPEMLYEGGILGLGYSGSINFFSDKINSSIAFHNVYLRLMVDYGFIFGLIIIFISMFIIFKIIKIYIFNYNIEIVLISFVLISGIISGFLEPSAMYEARYWWIPFWFFCGVILNIYKYEKSSIYFRR
tara:strand:+ start:855 stop:2078 length:1224 start_codon:yes stop_codon:yes gene_type:complete